MCVSERAYPERKTGTLEPEEHPEVPDTPVPLVQALA